MCFKNHSGFPFSLLSLFLKNFSETWIKPCWKSWLRKCNSFFLVHLFDNQKIESGLASYMSFCLGSDSANGYLTHFYMFSTEEAVTNTSSPEARRLVIFVQNLASSASKVPFRRMNKKCIEIAFLKKAWITSLLLLFVRYWYRFCGCWSKMGLYNNVE